MKVNKKYQIFCDMDGVLVDFEGAVVEQINKDLILCQIMVNGVNRFIVRKLGSNVS